MGHRAYGSVHRRVRAHLLAITPAWWPCPICGKELGYGPLDLAHIKADKRTGAPGDALAHRACNRRTNAKRHESAGERSRRQRAEAAAVAQEIAGSSRVW